MRTYLNNDILLFLHMQRVLFFPIARLHIYSPETDEPQTFLREILFRHVDLSRNLSKYPAAVDDGPNEFLPPFSREREFAILVDDTAERSPEGRFNFANLAGFSVEDLHRNSRGCQRRFPGPRSNSRMLFGCPISDRADAEIYRAI